MTDAGQIERDVTAFALGANDDLVVTTSTLAQIHRDVIIGLAAQHRIPAVYPFTGRMASLTALWNEINQPQVSTQLSLAF
jgi:hypothetical protein